MDVYFIFALLVLFSLKICELHLERCSLNLKFENNNFFTKDWLLWGQLYSYCMHSNVENNQSNKISSDEICVTTNCYECMSCFLIFCLNSTTGKNSESYKFGCQLDSSIADHINKNFWINEQDKPYINSISKIVSTKRECINITFMWQHVFSKNNMIPSVYLVTITSIDEDDSTECVIDLVSENILNVSKQLFCGMSNIPIQDIGTKFQLNVYPVNYNGYNESLKLTYKSLNDYILSSKEFTIIHGSLVGTLKVLKKVYTVSFNIKPTNYSRGLKSVLHITLGKNNNVYGDRNPGVWFHEDGTGKLVIFAAVNGSTTFYIETPPLKLGEWSYITICQSYLESKYWFSVFLNGINIIRTENSDTRDFKNMKVYASDCWYDAQDGYITDLLVINGHAEQLVGNKKTPLEKGKIIAEIPKLNEEYLISFDFYPNDFFPDWRSVVHFTIGSDYENYGDRTPGIWFEPGSNNKKIHISAPVNGNPNDIFSTPILNLIQKNQWSNIKVAQILLNKFYTFTIIINGTVVYEKVNNKYQSFDNVKVYASDPWYEAQGGFIKNFFVINGISNSNMQPIVVLPSDYINLNAEFTLMKGLYFGFLNVIKKEYTVSFSVKPTAFTKRQKNVLHFTLTKSLRDYGYRSPSVWFHQDGSGKLVIFPVVSNNTNYSIETVPLKLGEWSSVKISQSLKNSEYWLSVDLNGVNIHRMKNDKAVELRHIKVYASDPWYDALNGSISNILIVNQKVDYIIGNIPTKLLKGKVIAEIPRLSSEYIISFDLKSEKCFFDSCSVINFTFDIGNNNYDEKTPGVLLNYDGELSFTLPKYGCGPHVFKTGPINLDLWQNIEISQIKKVKTNSKNTYTIKINGEIVYSDVNYEPKYFESVKIYASDPLFQIHDGIIKNFFVVNGILNNEVESIVILPSDYIIQNKEVGLIQGTLLATMNVLMKNYTVSFNIKPTIYTNGLKSVLSLISDENLDRRFLSIFFHNGSSGKLVIFATINNSTYQIETAPLILNQWYSIKICQTLEGIIYWFSVELNGFNIYKEKNFNAEELKNIKVYASDPLYESQSGFISDILILNKYAEYIIGNAPTPLVRRKIIAVIPILYLEYIISFDINLSKFGSRLYNLICFKSNDGFNILFYIDDNESLQIIAPAIEQSFKTDFNGLSLWSNIVICQIYKNYKYLFTIRINGLDVFNKDIYEPKRFNNIEVYASYSWHNIQKGLIKSFFVVNDISSNMEFASEINTKITIYNEDYINFSDELSIIKGLLVGTLNILNKVFTLFFNVKPNEFSVGLKSVLYLILDDSYGDYSNKSLSIWFHQDGSGKLVIFAGLSDNASYYIETTPLLLGQWSSVKICQSFFDSNYWLSVDLNGVNIYTVNSSDVRDFKHVKVYASNLWNDTQNGSIVDLLIMNGKVEYLVGSVLTPLVKGKVIAKIPKLDKEYFISFDFLPNMFVFGLHSIICFTLSSKSCAFGIFINQLHDGNILILDSIYNNSNRVDITNQIDSNEFSNIVVEQTFIRDTTYEYTIRINREVVFFKMNDQPESYNDVFVYSSDPYFEVQNGLIKNLFIINGNINSSMQPVILLYPDYIYRREEFSITQGLFLGTLKVLMKVFTLSFNIKPRKYSNGLKSIFYILLDVYYGSYGNQNLSIWFSQDDSGVLSIYSTLSVYNNYSILTKPLQLDEWSTIKVYQTLSNRKYKFYVDLNETNIYSVENSNARNYQNIKVYASDPWHEAQNGLITDLLIINGNVEYIVKEIGILLKKEMIVAKIPILEKEYLISFDIYPRYFAFALHSVIYLTTGLDNMNNGEEVLGIWFNDNVLETSKNLMTTKLQIIAAINGNNTKTETSLVSLNKWSNIEVSQVLISKDYIYTIKINGQIIFSVPNDQAKSFDNVKIYASDPWSKPQDALIKNFFVVNGIASSSLQPIVLISPALPVSNTSREKNIFTTVAAILVPLFVLFILIVAVVLRIRQQNIKSQQSSSKFSLYKMEDFTDHHLHADVWEILPENIILDRKIGEGAFGTVFNGKINEKVFAQTNFANQKLKNTLFNIKENVAVKFLKDNANQSEFDDFLEEIKLMKDIGYHKNIVNMIGCSTITKPLCLVVEFMENGDLLHYLRNSRNKLTSSKEDGESCISFMYTDNYVQTLETKKGEELTSGFIPYDIPLNNIGSITPDDLLSFAWQVASGMEYLSFVKLVHRDLAARNILVGATKNVKISDFGLSRKTNNELNYTSNKSRRLPVKWMSVEAIFDQIFTTYSDVWAYGVVLFEIVTLGGTPYPSMSNHELIDRLKSGYRMERPENCSQPLYDIMLHCWNEDPLKRPTFTELREQFDKIMCQGDSYCNFDIYEKKDYYSSASFQSEKCEMFVNSLNNEALQKLAQLKPLEEQSDERYSCQILKNEFNEAEI